jgi:hypothetical protein
MEYILVTLKFLHNYLFLTKLNVFTKTVLKLDLGRDRSISRALTVDIVTIWGTI